MISGWRPELSSLDMLFMVVMVVIHMNFLDKNHVAGHGVCLMVQDDGRGGCGLGVP